VLALAVGLALVRGTRMVEPVALEEACAAAGIGRDGWVASLVALRDAGLLQLALSPSTQVVLVALTDAASSSEEPRCAEILHTGVFLHSSPGLVFFTHHAEHRRTGGLELLPDGR
jgi:hypothetical protein